MLARHRGKWEAISLDHDLGDEDDRTGFEFVQRMAEQDVWCPDIYVHSSNPEGRERMLAFITAEDARRGLAPNRMRVVARPDDHKGCESTFLCWYCTDDPDPDRDDQPSGSRL